MGFFRNIFQPPLYLKVPTDEGYSAPHGETEDWQVGDIAECITDDWFSGGLSSRPFSGLKCGDRHKVVGTRPCTIPQWHGHTMLVFAAFSPTDFASAGFRKVRPIADETEAADASFTDLIRKAPQELPTTPTREFEEAA